MNDHTPNVPPTDSPTYAKWSEFLADRKSERQQVKLKELEVALDVDNVLADFSNLYKECAEQVVGHSLNWVLDSWNCNEALGLSAELHSEVRDHVQMPGNCLLMNPLPYAIAGAKALREMVGDLYFVTRPYEGAPTWACERESWLIHHFGSEMGSQVIHTAHKHKVGVDILIDDHPEHVIRFLDEPWIRPRFGCIWATGYNEGVLFEGKGKTRLVRTNQWHALMELLKEWEATL
jgi:5'(3')-deoxyribonucleotidase